MEKFSKWRDEETGIHPFFHPKEKLHINIIVRILQILFGIIKFPFIALVFLIYYILSRIISLLPLPQALKRPIQRTIDCIGCRSLLFLFGFYWINTSFFRMTRKALPSFAPGSDISSGHLIIANKQSYIDILYFGFRFGATFANIPYDTKGEVIPVSIFGALFESIFNVTIFSERKLIQSSNVTTLADLLKTCKNHRGPVVIFPEGTSSNGRAILNCTNVLENLPISVDEIHVVGLKYEWTGFCPNYTLGNFIFHMLKLSGQVYNIMQVKYLTPLEIPPKGDDQEKWSLDIFNLLANTLRLKMIAIKPLQKRDFLEFYKKGTQRGYVGRMQ